MNAFDSANDERFDRKEYAGTPLLAAVEELCAQAIGRSLADMEQLTMREIYELAEECYGDDLPEFWRIWADWHRPDLEQPMGDL